jgi:hypothetical protein
VPTVAWKDKGFVGQGEQPGVNGFDDLAGVSAGKICTANASGKKGIAGNEELEGGEVEADGALGVAGRVEHLGRETGKAHGRAFGQRDIGRTGFRRLDAEPFCLLIHDAELFEVFLVHIDWRAGEPFELERATDVVDMRVGNEDLFQGESELGKAAVNAADLIAGIDDNGFARLLIAHQGAVAGEQTNREGFEDHVLIVGRFGAIRRGGLGGGRYFWSYSPCWKKLAKIVLRFAFYSL